MTLLAPHLLWLLVPALAALLAARLFRSRPRTIPVGSLLLWRRVAARVSAPRPRRLEFDLSFALQAATLALIVAALAGPLWVSAASPERTLFVLLDNGPLARARTGEKTLAFDMIRAAALKRVRALEANARVIVARSSPSPAVLINTRDSSAAVAAIDTLIPALSGPSTEDALAFLNANLRSLGGEGARGVVCSLRDDPNSVARASTGSVRWECVTDTVIRFDNVAIVAVGSLDMREKGRRIVARVANFSSSNVDGEVQLRPWPQKSTAESAALALKALTLKPDEDVNVEFSIDAPNMNSLTVEWRPADGKEDALPEDNIVYLSPRPQHPPRVRFHGAQPALRELFVSALNAEVVDEHANAHADLDVFVNVVPERLSDDCSAALFVEPSRGYRSVFDVGDKVLTWPKVVRGADDPLTMGLASVPGEIQIARAQEILETGDFTPLLRDEVSGRALALRFRDERVRPCYVFAFSPGQENASHVLPPALAALLLRIVKDAAQAGEPYSVVTAGALEAKLGQPIPIRNWDENFSVLDETASRLTTGKSVGSSPLDSEAVTALSISSAAPQTLVAWVAVLALCVALAETVRARRALAATPSGLKSRSSVYPG